MPHEKYMPLLIEYTWLTQIPCFGVFTRIIGIHNYTYDYVKPMYDLRSSNAVLSYFFQLLPTTNQFISLKEKDDMILRMANALPMT